MKSSPLLFLLVFSIKLSFSQFEYGLKGGLNFDSSGDILVVTDQFEKKGLWMVSPAITWVFMQKLIF